MTARAARSRCPSSWTPELPLVVRFPPQPLHSVRNEDRVPFHGTRIEFRQGFPG